MTDGDNTLDDDALTPGRILIAFEKLFSGGRGVDRLSRSGLRYVNLAGSTILIEQNPKKQSSWARLAHDGHRVAWVMRDRVYLARIVDGEVLMLEKKSKKSTKLKGESQESKLDRA